jgi:hypothetical protein
LIKGKLCLKKGNKVGRKPTAATTNWFMMKRKLFRKPTAVTMILEKKNGSWK